MKRILIALDDTLLHLFSLLKRYTPLGNKLATKVLKRIVGRQR
jgi:hypothetical protein